MNWNFCFGYRSGTDLILKWCRSCITFNSNWYAFYLCSKNKSLIHLNKYFCFLSIFSIFNEFHAIHIAWAFHRNVAVILYSCLLTNQKLYAATAHTLSCLVYCTIWSMRLARTYKLATHRDPIQMFQGRPTDNRMLSNQVLLRLFFIRLSSYQTFTWDMLSYALSHLTCGAHSLSLSSSIFYYSSLYKRQHCLIACICQPTTIERTQRMLCERTKSHTNIYMKRERKREVGGRRKVTFIRNVFLSVDGERESCTATKKKYTHKLHSAIDRILLIISVRLQRWERL